MKPMAVESILPPWLEGLRRTEIVRRVLDDARSKGATLFGLSADDAKAAVGWGQADFDQPAGGLSPDDLVLLYAYFLQRRHLEELTYAFRQMLSNQHLDDTPVVLDLGCGPCTGALALAAVLGSNASFEYIGVDRSVAMRRLGARLAAFAARSPDAAEIRCQWAGEIDNVEWDHPPRWRTVLVIVSYLFASRTLDPTSLANDLNEFLKQIGRGQVAILYTNSARAGPNRGLREFANRLNRFGFKQIRDDVGRIESQQSNKRYDLRYALFYRSRQNTLERTERE